MNKQNPFYKGSILWALIAVNWYAPATWAQVDHPLCTDEKTYSYEVRLDRYWAADCYQNHAGYQHLRKNLKDVLRITHNYRARTENTLDAAHLVYGLSEKFLVESSTSRDLLRILRDQIQASIDELELWDKKSSYKANASHWGKFVWTPREQGNSTWGALKGTLRSQGCLTTTYSAECEMLYSDALIAFSVNFAMLDVERYYRKPAINDRLRETKLNVDRWDSYLTGMQFQYPWELMLNYCYDHPRLGRRGDDFSRLPCFVPVWGGYAVRKHLQQQPDKGFVAPSDKRWVYLHPEVGIVYAESQPSGDKISPALTFQWIGRYFNVYDKSSGKIKAPWGLSIASVVADLPQSDNHGIGLMGHYKKWSVAVTKHGGDVVVTMNLNLLELIQDKSEYVDKFKGTYRQFAED